AERSLVVGNARGNIDGSVTSSPSCGPRRRATPRSCSVAPRFVDAVADAYQRIAIALQPTARSRLRRIQLLGDPRRRRQFVMRHAFLPRVAPGLLLCPPA